jgi:SynChlorMet cassette protein ScmD
MNRADGKAVRNESLVLREEFDDWAILFDPDTGLGFGMNPVAVMIWKHLDGRHTVSDIVEIIRKHFSDVTEKAQDEINVFINDLLEKGYAGYEL